MIGNHEIDYGIAHLLFLEKCAKFQIINANLHITTNNAGLFKSHHIIEIDGMKILFIGIITDTVISMAKKESLVGGFVDVYSFSYLTPEGKKIAKNKMNLIILIVL